MCTTVALAASLLSDSGSQELTVNSDGSKGILRIPTYRNKDTECSPTFRSFQMLVL